MYTPLATVCTLLAIVLCPNPALGVSLCTFLFCLVSDGGAYPSETGPQSVHTLQALQRRHSVHKGELRPGKARGSACSCTDSLFIQALTPHRHPHSSCTASLLMHVLTPHTGKACLSPLPRGVEQDLSKLNRDTRHVFYITANPKSVIQTENMILLPEWKPDSADDTALLDLLPFLECEWGPMVPLAVLNALCPPLYCTLVFSAVQYKLCAISCAAYAWRQLAQPYLSRRHTGGLDPINVLAVVRAVVSRQRAPDTRAVLASYEGQDIPTAFKQRAKEYQRYVLRHSLARTTVVLHVSSQCLFKCSWHKNLMIWTTRCSFSYCLPGSSAIVVSGKCRSESRAASLDSDDTWVRTTSSCVPSAVELRRCAQHFVMHRVEDQDASGVGPSATHTWTSPRLVAHSPP